MVKELTNDNFKEEVLHGEALALVDFWAPWCGPCMIQGPIIESLAKEYEGKPITIAKVNIEENQALAAEYGITSIPTIGIFQKGEMKERLIGVHEKEALSEKLAKYC